MYAPSDPRSTLGVTAGPTTVSSASFPEAIAAPEIADFSQLAPCELSEAGSRTWLLRAQNVLLAYTEAVPGERFVRRDDDEHLVLLVHPEATATVRADGDEAALQGLGMIAVPPGRSEVELPRGGAMVRLFEPDVELAARALNAEDYRRPHPRVALAVRSFTARASSDAAAVRGRLRAYPVGGLEKSPERFGRILRSRSFMVNFLFPHEGPRDARALSPHHHDDFEQLSVAVSGEFVHHIRTPWLSDSTLWRDDVHARVGSPSAAVIPPPTVHTSEAVGAGLNQLLDVFAPPRADFSAKQGWVLNADDYAEPA